MGSDREIREKLVSRGAAALSDCELISIVTGEGRGVSSAIDSASNIVDKHSLRELSTMPLTKLRMVEGLGISRAARLSAALELGRRLRLEEASAKDSIECSSDILEIFQPLFSKLSHEEFWVVYLNSANKIIDKVRLSKGGISGTVVDTKLVIKRAIELLTTAVILVHNHPSGVSAPSREDIDITDKICDAARLFDITVLDHLVIADSSYFSFRGEGLIK